MIDDYTRKRIEGIKKRLAEMDTYLYVWATPDQRVINEENNFSIAYACGPIHPAYSKEQAEEAWKKASADQVNIRSLPDDLAFLLSLVEKLAK